MKCKRIMFGRCRSGKTWRMEELILNNLKRGRRVIYFGRVGDSEQILYRAQQMIKGLSTEVISIQGLVTGAVVLPSLKHNSAKLTAQLMIFSMDPIINQPPKDNLFGDLFRLIKSHNSLGEDPLYDIYLDDAQLWGADIINTLPSNATIAIQSLSQLDYLLGVDASDLMVYRSQEWEFFSCSDNRTIDKGVELAGAKITPSELYSSKTGNSLLIERTVRANISKSDRSKGSSWRWWAHRICTAVKAYLRQ